MPGATSLCPSCASALVRLEGRGRSRKALPFGVRAVDCHLPGGGLALNSLHEVMETGAASEHAAVATLFIAGILARNKGPVLWCVRRRDLFAPALAAVGLPGSPDMRRSASSFRAEWLPRLPSCRSRRFASRSRPSSPYAGSA